MKKPKEEAGYESTEIVPGPTSDTPDDTVLVTDPSSIEAAQAEAPPDAPEYQANVERDPEEARLYECWKNGGMSKDEYDRALYTYTVAKVEKPASEESKKEYADDEPQT